MKQTNSSPNIQLIESITVREREILALMARHHTNKEIAVSLHLALSTVKWYTKQIYGKLTVNNRREAVERATELGILVGDQPRSKPNNLPSPSTTFVGREEEVEEIVSLLTKDEIRLVTLHGPGGSGKTRLAIQAASRLVKLGDTVFPNGLWYVSLTSLQIPDLIPQSIGNTIGYSYVGTKGEPLQQIVDYFKQRNLLLILDNFEHLISVESNRLISEIITHAPRIKILVTSRIRLNVQGEQIFPIGGLKTPQSDSSLDMDWEAYSAIQLFVHCAHRLQPKFEVNEQNLEPTIKICQLVEGMPLGIELASSWLEILSPQEIAAEIIRSLDFLEINQTEVTDRHRSIRAVFDSSWKLLSREEQDAFLHLSVFVGSFSREAAQKMSGATLQTLLGLANKSWLEHTETGRFQLHELMRQYGEERLKANSDYWQEVKDIHAAYYSNFVAKQSLKMQGSDQTEAMYAIKEEFATNIRAAWDWLTIHNRWEDLIEKMALGLFHFGHIRLQTKALITPFREARLKVKPEADDSEQLAFAILSTLEVFCEINSATMDHNPLQRLERTWKFVAVHSLAEPMGFWFILLASMMLTKNLDREAGGKLEEAVEHIRKQKHPWMLGMSLLIQSNWWADVSFHEGKLLEASRIFEDLGVVYEQCVADILLGKLAMEQRRKPAEIFHRFSRLKQLLNKRIDGHPFYAGFETFNPHPGFEIGIPKYYYFEHGESKQGFSFFHEEQRFFERLGDLRELALSIGWESQVAVIYDTFEHALDTRLRSQALIKKFGVDSDLSWGLYEFGELYRVFGDFQKAKELHEQARVDFERLKLVLGLGYYHRAQGDIAIQESRYADALASYQKYMKYAKLDNHLWSMAQAHIKLAWSYAHLGNLQQSRLELHNAFVEMRTWNEIYIILQSLMVESLCLIQENKFEEAIELAALILNHPASGTETKQETKLLLEEASSQLSPKVVAAAKQRGEKLVLDDMVRRYI